MCNRVSLKWLCQAYGAPGVTRTRNHPLRRRVLYPIELRGRKGDFSAYLFLAEKPGLEPAVVALRSALE